MIYTKRCVFITLQKGNAVYMLVSEKLLTVHDSDGVLKDENIEIFYKDADSAEQILTIRRISWRNNDGSKCYEFITNNFELEAQVIAAICRFRWQIELFFKKLSRISPPLFCGR